MSIDSALEQYFDAWNSHRPEAVPAALTDGGTYEDPTTGGPLSGDALTASVAGVMAGFPDVHFEIDSVATTGDRATAQWRMQGTNTGPLPGGPATGGTLDLPGADFFTYDGDADKISSVVGYFDTATMLGQLGLQAHITPADVDGMIGYGIGVKVETGRDTIPGALTITWIEVEPEYQSTLVDDDHRDRDRATRQRRVPRHDVRDDRPSELHLHRVDVGGCGASRVPRQRPHQRDEAGPGGWHRRDRPRGDERVDARVPQRRVPCERGLVADLAELGGQWL